MVVVGTGGIRSKILKDKYPVDEGLTAGTTKLPTEWRLEPEESLVSSNDEVGL